VEAFAGTGSSPAALGTYILALQSGQSERERRAAVEWTANA